MYTHNTCNYMYCGYKLWLHTCILWVSCCGEPVVEDHVHIVEDKVCIVDNNLWVTCCGCTHVSCGVGIVEDCVCIVGAASTHNICVCTHNMYPQCVQLCTLWVQIVGAHICIVGNTLWATCCGGSCIYCGGQGIYCGQQLVGNVLLVHTCPVE